MPGLALAAAKLTVSNVQVVLAFPMKVSVPVQRLRSIDLPVHAIGQ